MKTSELTGAALNYAVAKCEGNPVSCQYWHKYTYAEDWSQGGPIIEREGLLIEPIHNTIGCGSLVSIKYWYAMSFKNFGGIIQYSGTGPTPLIAAMRCYVANNLGEEVEIPEALI